MGRHALRLFPRQQLTLVFSAPSLATSLFRLSKNHPTKGLGGKDSVKGNRQGSLSRPINTLFETFYGVSKSAFNLSKKSKDFFDRLNRLRPSGQGLFDRGADKTASAA